MNNLKITEGMVLALLGKGMSYELENCEMEYDIDVPLDIFGCGDEDHPSTMKMHMTMKIEKLKFEIHKD